MMMRKSKRERLEAKGWRFGTAQEFLGLSNEESAYIELRVRLADSLRQRRQKRNLSQVELARVVHSSQSRVAKMESGDPTVSLDLLIRSLLALGASARDIARAISGQPLAKAS
jgi:ribosome-binding protein aMBF1 (putative translation factor)